MNQLQLPLSLVSVVFTIHTKNMYVQKSVRVLILLLFIFYQTEKNSVIPGIKEENRRLGTHSRVPSIFALHVILLHICSSLPFPFAHEWKLHRCHHKKKKHWLNTNTYFTVPHRTRCRTSFEKKEHSPRQHDFLTAADHEYCKRRINIQIRGTAWNKMPLSLRILFTFLSQGKHVYIFFTNTKKWKLQNTITQLFSCDY